MSWSLERQSDGPRRRDQPAELISSMGVDGDPTLIPNVLALKAGRWLRRSDEVVVGDKLSREKGIGPGQHTSPGRPRLPGRRRRQAARLRLQRRTPSPTSTTAPSASGPTSAT